jgi:hypothetical protein
LKEIEHELCKPMASGPPRLLIVDQHLRNFEGHHYEYDLAVVRAARQLGLDVTLAAHNDFTDSVVEGVKTVHHFRVDDPGRSLIISSTRRLFTYLPRHFRHAALASVGTVKSHFASRSSASRELGTAIGDLIATMGLSKRDFVFVHTLTESDLLELTRGLPASTELPSLNLLLRYELRPHIVRSAMTSILNDARLAQSYRFWTDTEQLATYYRQLGIPRIDVLPIPHSHPGDELQSCAQEQQIILGFLGGAREDKGFHLLPALVEGLAKDYLVTGRARFLIQCSHSFDLDATLVERTVRRLGAFPDSWVELINDPMPQAEFQRALRSTHILLLPYRRDTYRRRSSGLLIQAAAAGIPTVVPAGTWLAQAAPKEAHVSFGSETPLLEATRQAIETFPSLSDAACAAAPHIRRANESRTLVECITGDEINPPILARGVRSDDA